MPFIDRFSTIERGAVTVTGNTLGLSGNLTNPAPLPAGVPAGPAAVDSIGAFITTNNGLQVPGGWPVGTTLNWQENSSSTKLNIPAGSTVLYAELIWSGICVNADQNVTAFLNNSVNLTTPSGTTAVAPDPATATTISAGSSGNTAYVRSQNVTALVQAGGSGTYTLGSVPGALGNSVNNPSPTNVTPQNFLAWTLEVVYQNPALPLRSMTVWVNDTLINAASPPLDINITGFETPAIGPLNGKVFIVSVEGDANIVGDQALFGPNTGSLTVLGNPVTTPNPNPGTPPNNPINNFFGSQINGENCLLDTTGTFGTSNQDSFQGVNFVAARQGLDIACIDLTSPILQNSQTSAVLRLTTVGDAYGNIGGAIQINGIEPIFNPIKTVDKAVAQVGDVLNYTVTFTNTGTAHVDNLVLTDLLPVGSSFVLGSVIVDGTPNPGANPSAGIAIGTVSIGQTVVVSYKATVVSIPPTPPSPPQLINDSIIQYEFEPVVGTIIKGSNISTQSITEIKKVEVSVAKSVDKTFAKVGDIITYTVVVNNTGTVASNNTIFTDPIPLGTSFVLNSVTVNGVAQPGADPSLGVNIGTISSGGNKTVAFKVKVETIPNPNPIPNIAAVKGDFIIDPNNPPVEGNFTSNEVKTQVNTAIINEVKAVDKAIAVIGDVLTYTVILSNTGNVSADNVIFKDSIPNGTSFVIGSLTVNGISQVGDPNVGVNIGSIATGATKTVEFKVTVTGIPSPNPIPNTSTSAYEFLVDPAQPPVSNNTNSNTVYTQVNNASLIMTKQVDKDFANIGDVVTYTVILANSGNISADNVIFTDVIPNDTSFVANSVTVGGVAKPGFDPNVGFNIGTILSGGNLLVTFKVKIESMPSINPIPNTASSKFEYTPIPGGATLNGSSTSNEVTTQVNNANIILDKIVDKQFASIGDTLTYSVTLSNSGNVSANNVVFTDLVPNGASFIIDSVTVGGISKPGYDPNLGFPIGSILPGNSIIVTFKVKVMAIPNPNPMPNVANVSYEFLVHPNEQPVKANGISNEVNTLVSIASISGVKSVDKDFANVGEVLTYTVTLENTGNVTAQNVIFTDPIPNGTSFVLDSVTVGGIPQPGYDPNVGFNIGNILSGTSVIITFKVKINEIPQTNPIPNTASAAFQYIVNPNNPPVNGTVTTNTVTTRVSNASVIAIKNVDKEFANVGDILTYSVNLTNNGDVSADNVIFKDLIPNGTSFVLNSVTVGGITQPGFDPSLGFNIGSILAGASVEVTFKVKVEAIPNPNPIPNSAQINYEFIVDPDNPPVSSSTTSNEVTTQINNANVTGVKSVDKQYADIGDTLTYTVTLNNKGNVPATNVIFTDSIPLGTAFVSGSLTINGISNPGNPASGVNIGTIQSQATTIITFKVTVMEIPNPNPIPNFATANYQYLVDPNGQPQNGSLTTNTVTTLVNHGEVEIVKSVDKTFANVGDVITYSSTLVNTGNIAVDNVIFTDIIPNDTTFVTNSVTVNGVPQIGVDPSLGFNIGTIQVQEVKTVTFKVKVDRIPNPNPIPNVANSAFEYTVTPGQGPKTGEATSNEVTTQVNNADITAVKVVDKAYANVGDILTYTVTLNNIGNVKADNVIFKDAIPAGTSFVINSVSVDGIAKPGFDPEIGFNVGSILPSGYLVVSFKVKVDIIPNPNPIPNEAEVNYEFSVDPNLPPVQSSVTSNTVTTQVNNSNVLVVKAVDKQIADVGDVLTYTVTLTNTGNVSANNIIFTDPIPQGTNFVLDSVTVGGVPQPGKDPSVGFNIGTILSGQIVVVTFKVKVDSIPTINPIPNAANIKYQFIINPNEPPVNNDVTSNTVTTQINNAKILSTKIVDKQFVDVGEVISYTVTLTNTGNVSANGVMFKDPLPLGTSFVQNSVTVNGIGQPGANPVSGVNVGTIQPGAVTTVSFKIMVNEIPNPNPIPNTAVTEYSYIVDPNQPPVEASSESNKVETQVNNANIVGTKIVDKSYANVGDILTYTVTLKNSGNVTANNVIFTDAIPSGTSFVLDSLTIDGIIQIGVNPASGVNVGSIASNGSKVVTFKIKIEEIPNPNPIPNSGEISYEYTVTPGQAPVSKETLTNTVTTQVNNANITSTKAVDKEFANIGDILTYTTTLTNIGNVIASNIIFTDAIPNGTSFVLDSVTVGGVSKPGLNPSVGFNIGSIPSGGTIIVTFKVKVETIPQVNPIPNTAKVNYEFLVNPNEAPVKGEGVTNTVITRVNNANIEAIKVVDKSFANVGDTLTYSVTLTNKGNVVANNVIVKDLIPDGTNFILNSVTVDGVIKPGEDPSSGVSVGSILAGESLIVTFKVKVEAIPLVNPIPNSADVSFNFFVDPNGQPVEGNTTSNVVTTKVNNANIEALKETDKDFANIGDLITYTVKLKNNGNVSADNVIFNDSIPNGTSFVENSVTVDGIQKPGENPQTGVNLGSIPAGASVIVTFKIKVETIPNINPIPNAANVDYEYTVDPTKPPVEGTSNSNTVETKVNNAKIDGVKAVDKQYADVGDILTYSVTLTNKGNVSANNVIFKDLIPSGTSFVENSLTINGILQIGANPSAGVNLGSIAPSAFVVVSFKIKVETIPNPNPIPNEAKVDFNFIVDPDKAPIDDSTTTNQVLTQINNANLEALKVVDKQFADIGDLVTYTVTLTNTGNINANNVIFTDIIPAGTSFVENSIVVDGVSKPGENPSSGVNLGNIPPSQSKIVSFKVKVQTIPTPNPIPNLADVEYEYIVNPLQPPVVKNVNTNTVYTEVKNATIIANKNVDRNFADVGDIITYSVTLSNVGNTAANNVLFTDAVPSGTIFVNGSVTVNGIQQPDASPISGVNVGTIDVGKNIVVTFKVKVQVIPSPNPIVNVANVNFDYIVDPAKPPVNKNTTSNEVTTLINNATIEAIKDVDKKFADVGDIITYTVSLTNKGNVNATNVKFIDSIPEGTSFISDSVTVNGIAKPGLNPESGVDVGIILPLETSVVTFKVKVEKIPNPNPIPNTAIINFSYVVDTTKPPVNKETESNEVKTQVNNANIEAIKIGDKEFADVGDTITYTVNLKNTGNVIATDVVLKDSLPEGTSFVLNSVTVGGIAIPNTNPETGIAVGNILVNQSVNVTFKAKVEFIPANNPIKNKAEVRFKYVVDPVKPPVEKETESNEVKTQINNAQLQVIKTVDKNYATVGDILTYSFNIKNIGNVTATNVIFKDAIPNGTNYILNSFAINGVIQPGANISSGVILGNIPAGGTVTVTFDVLVTSIPVPNPAENNAVLSYKHIVDPGKPPVEKTSESNKVKTQVNLARLEANKVVDKKEVVVGDNVTYTISVKNTGNVDAQNVVLKDKAPAGTTFVNGSVLINGLASPLANPEVGINIANIAPGATVVVSFIVKVEERLSPPEIVNLAEVDYKFIVDPSKPPVEKKTETNEVISKVEIVKVDVIKVADKTSVLIGDIITYTITITNNGTITAKNVFFKDEIPDGTTLIPGSLIPVPGDPSVGVNLGDILPGKSITVSFKVKVEYVPCNLQIINKAIVKFSYGLDGRVIESTSTSNIVSIDAGPTAFKQMYVNEDLKIPCQKPDAEDILNAIVEVEILAAYPIKTIKAKSLEGQILTGKKLIVEGLLMQKVEYIAKDEVQSVHVAEFDTPFSTFIVLPETFNDDSDVDVEGIVEDIYTKLVDKRTIFKNVTFRLIAKVNC